MASRPGERKLQILQTLAEMLEMPQGEKITTASLAARLDCSEAALYRHFASKAQMFEGLIEFIESTLFGLINRIQAEHASSLHQTKAILRVLLQFAETNRGMTRVLIGDALVHENDRLQTRISGLLDKVESALKQALQIPGDAPTANDKRDVAAIANVLRCFVVGRWEQFARSGFRRLPTAQWSQQWPLLAVLCER